MLLANNFVKLFKHYKRTKVNIITNTKKIFDYEFYLFFFFKVQKLKQYQLFTSVYYFNVKK